MADQFRLTPNYYSERLTVSASTTAGAGAAFGFNARYLKLLNTEATDFYVKLGATGELVATTADMRVRACSEVVLPGLPPVFGLAAYTTSTAAAAKVLDVTALGD